MTAIKTTHKNIFLALLAGMVMLAPISQAQARPGKGPGRVLTQAKGTVSAVGADSVTIVREDSSTVTFSVVANTVFSGPDRNADGASNLADLQVGDQIGVTAYQTLALGIRYPIVVLTKTPGILTSTGENSLTVQKADGTTATFSVDSSTQFEGPDRNGDAASTLADLQAGDLVGVKSNNTGLAVEVHYRPAPAPRPVAMVGVVSAVSAGSLTLTRVDGTSATLVVDADTKVKSRDRNSDGAVNILDIQVGDPIIVKASADSSTALAVMLRGKERGHHKGQAKAKAKAKARR